MYANDPSEKSRHANVFAGNAAAHANEAAEKERAAQTTVSESTDFESDGGNDAQISKSGSSASS